MLISASTPTISLAETKCSDVIAACDKAIAAKDGEISAKNDVIKKQDDVNAMLNQKVVDLEAKDRSIFRNPYVLIGVGLIGGFLIAK